MKHKEDLMRAAAQVGSFTQFLRRMAAYLVDIVLAFIILAPLGMLVEWAFKILPVTGPEIWLATALNFSLPVWIYFTLSDSRWGGATVGKRLLKLCVASQETLNPPHFWRALLRTAVKLLPWELVHISVFGFSQNLAQLTPVQSTGLTLANVLVVVYLVLALVTGGLKSAHDYIANTVVVNNPSFWLVHK